MRDLYSIGELLIDFIPGSEPDSYVRKAGGAPANVAIAVSTNGLDAAMACKVGDDGFGRIGEWIAGNGKRLDPSRPFFYVQHPHLKDTCYGPWAWGHDKGAATKAPRQRRSRHSRTQLQSQAIRTIR